jgi:hypothetical protein
MSCERLLSFVTSISFRGDYRGVEAPVIEPLGKAGRLFDLGCMTRDGR